MRKKIVKTGLWLIVATAWFGIIKLIRYQVAMYYANVVPSQMDDDTAYSKLQTQGTVSTSLTILTWVVAILIFYRIYKIWDSEESQTS